MFAWCVLELRLEQVDCCRVVFVLDVFLDQAAARGRIVRAQIGRHLVASQRAGRIAAALEHLSRSHFELGLGFRSGGLVAELVDGSERALGVANHRTQRRERVERARVARRKLEHALVSRERAVGLYQIFGQHATE